ncbi:MAG: hypothetical protein V4559_11380 [Pseudomonadota bacterium]
MRFAHAWEAGLGRLHYWKEKEKLPNQIQPDGRFDLRGFFLADKLDADAMFVMAGDTAGHLGDQDKFADGRTNIGLERNAAGGNVHHLALHDLTVGASEFGEAFLIGAFVTAHDRFVDQVLVEKKGQLLGGPFALQGRARKEHTEAGIIHSHDVAFEAAKSIHIQNDLRPRLRQHLAGDRGAAWRQIADLAARFIAIDGGKQAAGQIDTHAAKTPTFDTGLNKCGLAFCHYQRQAIEDQSRITVVRPVLRSCRQ